ncbi:MAG: M23 family metallopeptidase [Acidimicrobiia bacterium]|nr:M23 family metallopeptidase [Acidimicrobiia bacterium]
MRTRFSTRALTAILAVFGLAAFRALPAGSSGERPLSEEPTIQAAAALPVVALDASYPAGDAPPPTSPALNWPVPGRITSPFGDHRNHPGVDLHAAMGDPVAAAGDGTVVLAGMAPAGFAGYGNLVMIDHGGGIATLYAHLSRVDVTMGEVVRQGQLLGAVGATGVATGPHLHFEVRVDNKPTDPVPWLPPRT